MSETAAESPLETRIEDAGPCRKKLAVTVPVERVRDELDNAFLDLIRNVQVPGFRQGHLPRKFAEQRFGNAVRHEVKGSLLEKAFGEAVEKHGLSPLGDPELDARGLEIDPAKPFSFEVFVEVRPEIKVPDVKGAKIKRPEVKVEPKHVEEALENLRLDRADLVPAADGTVAARDVVVLDAAVQVDGREVIRAENLEYRHPSEVVAGVSVPEAPAALLGKKSGESASLPMKLPANFKRPEHAGKDGELVLTVRDVKRFQLPTVDAEFAKSLDFDTVDELRAEVEKAVHREMEQRADKAVDAAILDEALSRSPIELPAGIVKKEIGQVLSRYQAEMHMQGAPDRVIEEKLAEVQGRAAEQVEREFRVAFLVDEIAKKRGLFVTENEVEEQVVQMAGQYGKSPEEMRRHLEQRGLLGSLRGRLRERKVLDALKADVVVE
jgi:trigger factor